MIFSPFARADLNRSAVDKSEISGAIARMLGICFGDDNWKVTSYSCSTSIWWSAKDAVPPKLWPQSLQNAVQIVPSLSVIFALLHLGHVFIFSDCEGWRAGCMAGERRSPEAARVTAGAVCCSAWFGVAAIVEIRPKII